MSSNSATEVVAPVSTKPAATKPLNTSTDCTDHLKANRDATVQNGENKGKLKYNTAEFSDWYPKVLARAVRAIPAKEADAGINLQSANKNFDPVADELWYEAVPNTKEQAMLLYRIIVRNKKTKEIKYKGNPVKEDVLAKMQKSKKGNIIDNQSLAYEVVKMPCVGFKIFNTHIDDIYKSWKHGSPAHNVAPFAKPVVTIHIPVGDLPLVNDDGVTRGVVEPLRHMFEDAVSWALLDADNDGKFHKIFNDDDVAAILSIMSGKSEDAAKEHLIKSAMKDYSQTGHGKVLKIVRPKKDGKTEKRPYIVISLDLFEFVTEEEFSKRPLHADPRINEIEAMPQMEYPKGPGTNKSKVKGHWVWIGDDPSKVRLSALRNKLLGKSRDDKTTANPPWNFFDDAVKELGNPMIGEVQLNVSPLMAVGSEGTCCIKHKVFVRRVIIRAVSPLRGGAGCGNNEEVDSDDEPDDNDDMETSFETGGEGMEVDSEDEAPIKPSAGKKPRVE